MAAIMTMTRMGPESVHEMLGRHMLADGYDMVLDLEKSRGRRLWDARRERRYLDMFSFFATLPVGINHPGLAAAGVPREAACGPRSRTRRTPTSTRPSSRSSWRRSAASACVPT